MSTVARRYAKALFGLAHDAGVLEPTMEQLNHMAAIANDPAVAPVLRNPLLSADCRAAVAALMAREVAASDLLTRFARLLADHQRLAELPAIAAEVQRMLDDALGRVRITIRSAQPLAPQQHDAIVATFEHLTGKRIVPQTVTQPDLLGGVLVEAQGKVYDGSVRTQLNRLAKQLGGAAAL